MSETPIRSLVISNPRLDESWFSEAELEAMHAHKLQKRRQEWMRARLAAKRLAIQLGLATEPRSVAVHRPFLTIYGVPTEWRVSLSHSGLCGAAAIDRLPVGIDIQAVRELSESAAHLFLRDDEIEAMQRCTLPNRILHFWCAKEAAWKARSHELETLKQLPLTLLGQREDGLRFDAVNTAVLPGDLILGLTV
jgi:4'-phosphopantetheinyl transferase EntD